MKPFLHILLVWSGMMIVAIANGAFRESVLRRNLDELPAHQVSTLLLIALQTLFVAIVVRKKPFDTTVPAILIGIVWLALTLAFEFGFGHFAAGHSWSRLLQEYNVLEGRIWILVPVYLIVLPFCLTQFQRKLHRGNA